MATSSTDKLVKIIQEGQVQMLDYLRRADERGERQSRATLKALAALHDSIRDGQKTLHDGQKVLHDGQKVLLDGQKVLHDGQKTLHDGQKTLHDGQKTLLDGQKTLGQMLLDMQAITVRALDLTRDIHSEVLDKKSSQH